MKKILMVFVLLSAVGGSGVYWFFLKPSTLENAKKAELRGQYDSASVYFIHAAFQTTQSIDFVDNNKFVTFSQSEWMTRVEKYLAWVSYSIAEDQGEYLEALAGITRCHAYQTKTNFITQKDPKQLDVSLYSKNWHSAFTRDQDGKDVYEPLIHRAFADSVSFLSIRAMNGYIYHSSLLDSTTGKITKFILYPNSSITLLVKPRPYYLICTSEVQITEGLQGKTWRSSEIVIPLQFSYPQNLHSVTLKTRVRRGN